MNSDEGIGLTSVQNFRAIGFVVPNINCKTVLNFLQLPIYLPMIRNIAALMNHRCGNMVFTLYLFCKILRQSSNFDGDEQNFFSVLRSR